MGNIQGIYREFLRMYIYIGNNIYREYHGILENHMKINWLENGQMRDLTELALSDIGVHPKLAILRKKMRFRPVGLYPHA
jgi:hypothetical protein